MSYKGGTSLCEKYMYDPNRPKKPRASNSSKVKKSKREAHGPVVDSFKAYHPYGIHTQPLAASRSPSSLRTQPVDPLSFSPQMPIMSLPSSTSPAPRVRPVARHPMPIARQQSPASSLRYLLHAIEGYQGSTTAHERHHSPEGLSQLYSYGSASSHSCRSRSSSPASTPPLTPHSASSRLSVASSRSSSRHPSPEPNKYYATYANAKPNTYEYDQFLGSYHTTVDQGLYPRRH